VTRVGAALLALTLLAGCADDGGDAPTSTSAGATTTSATVATTTPPATTLPTTAPRPAALPGGGLEVLVVGDSVMHDASAAIEAALTATGAVTVRPGAAFGLGFSDSAGIPFADAAPELLAGAPVEQVVVMVGSWDHIAAQRDPEGYATEVDAALRTLTEGSRSVLVLGEPPSAPAKGEEAVRVVVNEVLEAAVAEVPRAVFLSTDTVIGDAEGDFLREGPDGLLRKPDGRHLCPAGATRFGVAVLAALEATWALPEADPTWAVGPWRADARYDDPPGGCGAL
jgi:hypothetical protein